jgi:hypothetical protein
MEGKILLHWRGIYQKSLKTLMQKIGMTAGQLRN